jgi:hypothetical protein
VDVDIVLFDTFYKHPQRLENFMLLRNLPLAVRQLAFHRYQPGTLLHEIIHAVTMCGGNRRNMLDYTRLGEYITSHDLRLTYPNTLPKDMVVDIDLKHFRDTKSTAGTLCINECLLTSGCGTKAYGPNNAQYLARLNRGAVASLLNADNYTLCVQDCVYKHITHVPQPDSDAELQRAYGALISYNGTRELSRFKPWAKTLRETGIIRDIFADRGCKIRALRDKAPVMLPAEAVGVASDVMGLFDPRTI